VPSHRRLREDVRALLQRGERCIVLDFTHVSSIDAGGVGELVRAYKMTTAMNGFLRVDRPTAWVRQTLDRAGLAHLLTAEAAAA
jgi:anti-anti-sigma factor